MFYLTVIKVCLTSADFHLSIIFVGRFIAMFCFQDMADLLMRKFDEDRDGRLTYEEFGNEIRKFPEQLELCGQVRSVLSKISG